MPEKKSESLSPQESASPKSVESEAASFPLELPKAPQSPQESIKELKSNLEKTFETPETSEKLQEEKRDGYVGSSEELVWEDAPPAQALDISIVRQKFNENPNLKKVKATFTIHGKDRNTDQQQDETFTVAYVSYEQRIDFSITSETSIKRNLSGDYRYLRGKQNLGLGANMQNLSGFGYYSQIMAGLLQHVDVTENYINNEEVAEVYRKYSTGDYVVPSVFASRSQLVAARKGFLCFINVSSVKGQEGMSFVGIRVPDALKEILERAKNWESANYDTVKKEEFNKNNPDFDPLQEAGKIKQYIESNRDILTETWGFYYNDCMRLLELQIERFEQMFQGKDLYHPMGKKKIPKPVPKPSWVKRLFGR